MVIYRDVEPGSVCFCLTGSPPSDDQTRRTGLSTGHVCVGTGETRNVGLRFVTTGGGRVPFEKVGTSSREGRI